MEAIGAVLASLGDTGADAMPMESAEPVQLGLDADAVEEAAVVGDFVPLVEAAVRKDGTARVKVISAGWGSSGFYPVEVLKRDAAIFRKGLHMHWDHQTAAQEAEKPEGSLTTLAGELISDASWQDSGPSGPGLYADAKVFAPFRDAVNELAPHIGVSIRASGRTRQGEADGRKGPIVEQLIAARSLDYVTIPGAGGKVVEMFEAARPAVTAIVEESEEDQHMELQEQLNEANARILVLQQDAARLREALLIRDARDQTRTALATAQVPDVTRARLLESLSVNPPTGEDGSLDVPALANRITEAVTAEQTYLAQASGYGSGKITGMGGGKTETAVDVSARMKEAFGLLGLSPAEAEIAANGR
jgi:hypothetical protein